MRSTIHMIAILLAAIFALASDAFSNGCDLPSPDHPDPIQPIELREGMIYRYPYSSFTAVADVPGVSGSGHSISFKAKQAGSFKIRIYRDLKGHSLVSEGETILNLTNGQKSNTIRK